MTTATERDERLAEESSDQVAEWSGDRYEVRSLGWLSRDGDEWTFSSTGLPCDGPLFERSAIVLRGGTRDGVVVR